MVGTTSGTTTPNTITMNPIIFPPDELNLTGNVEQNWRTFRQSFELYTVAIGLEGDERRAIALLLTVAGRGAMDVYNTFTFAEGERDSYAAVVAKFARYCATRGSETCERYAFRCRVQREREPLDRYLAELTRRSRSCNFGSQCDSMIRDQLVLGLRDSRVRALLLDEGDLTLERAVKMCRAAETAAAAEKEEEEVEEEEEEGPPPVPEARATLKRKEPSSSLSPPETPPAGDGDAAGAGDGDAAGAGDGDAGSAERQRLLATSRGLVLQLPRLRVLVSRHGRSGGAAAADDDRRRDGGRPRYSSQCFKDFVENYGMDHIMPIPRSRGPAGTEGGSTPQSEGGSTHRSEGGSTPRSPRSKGTQGSTGGSTGGSTPRSPRSKGTEGGSTWGSTPRSQGPAETRGGECTKRQIVRPMRLIEEMPRARGWDRNVRTVQIKQEDE